jgi:hypothetical protein
VLWRRVKCTSTSSSSTSLKTSTVVHGPLQKSNNQCPCLRSSSTCTNVCGHLHIFIQWEYVIVISNHRISSWIQLVGSSNYVISEVQRFLSGENQMSVISVLDTIVLLNSFLERRITLHILVYTLYCYAHCRYLVNWMCNGGITNRLTVIPWRIRYRSTRRNHQSSRNSFEGTNTNHESELHGT